MLKVRLKQICGKWGKYKIKLIEFHSLVSYATLSCVAFLCAFVRHWAKKSGGFLCETICRLLVWENKKASAKETYGHFKQHFCSAGPSQFTINALSYLMLKIPRAGTLEASNHTHWHTLSACSYTLTHTHTRTHTSHRKHNEFNTTAITVN